MDNDRPLFILAGNGPYDNRGCEAIVRGTVKILREYFRDPRFICISHFNNFEQFKQQCSLEVDPAITHKCGIIGDNCLRKVYQNVLLNFSQISYAKSVYHNIIADLKNADAILSIGGDNYSFKPNTKVPFNYTSLDQLIKSTNLPLIIWGASIGPFSEHPPTERYMANHLKKVDAIYARESETINYLSQIGVKENVYSVSDPAFVMDPIQPGGQKKIDIPKNSIGLNFSNIMANYVTEGNLLKWRNIVIDIINELSTDLDGEIYLIPHVTVPGGDDYQFLKIIHSNLPRKNNITLIPPHYNAQETKWIISKMKIFGGGRTHSTIAALSSNVPTILFAYSIKAKGIGHDIYGNSRFCVTPEGDYLKNVKDQFFSLYENSNQIKNELEEIIPKIKMKAFNAGKFLFERLTNSAHDL